jgi:hypothetical protein
VCEDNASFLKFRCLVIENQNVNRFLSGIEGIFPVFLGVDCHMIGT